MDQTAPLPRDASVWDIVSRPGVLVALEAVAQKERRDWPFASWSALSAVDETLIRMHGQRELPTEPEAFLAAFTIHLTRHLADRYRRKHAKKRGGRMVRRALDRLAALVGRSERLDPDMAGLVEEYVRREPLLAVIAWMTSDLGMDVGEIATLLDIDEASVLRKLRRVKADLRKELEPHEPGD